MSLLQEEKYSASASLLFRDPGFAQNIFSGDSGTAVGFDSNRQAATNLQLVELESISALAAEKLDLGMTASEIQGRVEIGALGSSDLVTVTATDSDPETARVIADAVASEFIAFRAETDRSKLLEAKRLADRQFNALSLAEQQGARGNQLSQGSERLGILATLQTGNAELVQRASRPEVPSSPKPFRNGVIGGVLGLILGFVMAFGLERFDRRLRSPDEVGDAFELPVLATVPHSSAIVQANQGGSLAGLPFVENESFRTLRATLRYFSVDKEIESVLLTSYSAQVGKSTVSWNLACVACTSSRVILVETDLRKPSLARQQGVKIGPGLSEVLTHQVGLESAIQTVSMDTTHSSDDGPGTSVDVIVAGSVPPNPAELLESQTMVGTLETLREDYDLVIVDTSPIGVVSDAFPLVSQVDGVVIVARVGASKRDEARQLRLQLDRLDAPLLGVVANDVKGKRGGYYSYYGAGYDSETAAATVSSS